MGECVNLATCRFFNETLHDTPEVVHEGFKTQYCHGENERCARRVAAEIVGRENVPPDLGPHESAKAIKLVQSYGHVGSSALFV